jgi:hypothetical protein
MTSADAQPAAEPDVTPKMSKTRAAVQKKVSICQPYPTCGLTGEHCDARKIKPLNARANAEAVGCAQSRRDEQRAAARKRQRDDRDGPEDPAPRRELDEEGADE